MAETFERARALILANVFPLSAEDVPLLDAVGRVIGKEVKAPCDMPRWDNSAMDGYAVRTEDCSPLCSLLLSGYIPAGGNAKNVVVNPGHAIKIMTGAPTPGGCDAIVPLEDAEEDGDYVTIKVRPRVGGHIRVCGEDMHEGEEVIPSGRILRPTEINLLASFGMKTVPVYRRPEVAILSTGDELVNPGESPGPGQVVNSNAYSLAAAVSELGGVPHILGIARDSRESLTAKLNDGFKADALITTAGVSMGDRDLVCEMLGEAGVVSLFWKVDIKPGRPTAFGVKNGKPVFSLPGNPVSAMITFEELVRPALLKMMGHQTVIKPFVKAILQEPTTKKSGRVQFLRVQVVDNGGQLLATSAGDQNTGILMTMIRANGIAVLPADRDQIDAGEEVDVHMIGPEIQTS